jgi:hypothetical protein
VEEGSNEAGTGRMRPEDLEGAWPAKSCKADSWQGRASVGVRRWERIIFVEGPRNPGVQKRREREGGREGER